METNESIIDQLMLAIAKTIKDSPWDRITGKEKIKDYEYYSLGNHNDLIADFCLELAENFKNKTTFHLSSVTIAPDSLRILYKIW